MERTLIGRRDREGKEVQVGDAFEYGDCIYIVCESEEKGGIYIRVFENQVEYGVDHDPIYVERPNLDPIMVEFEEDRVFGNIDTTKFVKELYDREENIIPEDDEYDEYDDPDEDD